MVEVLDFAGICGRVVLGLIFLLTPGMLFWLGVVGIGASIRRVGRSNLWQSMRNKTPWASTSRL